MVRTALVWNLFSACKWALLTLCLLAASVSFAPTALAWSGGWSDGNLQQFYVLQGDTPDAKQSSFTTFDGTTVALAGEDVINGFNGRTNTSAPAETAAYAFNKNWLRVDLRVPQTLGTVTLNLSKVRVCFKTGTGSAFSIETTNADDPNSATWTATTAVVGAADTYTDVTFAPRATKWVRLINSSGGAKDFWEMDFFGTTTVSGGSFVSPGTVVTKRHLDLLKQRIENGTHPAGLTLARLKTLWGNSTPPYVPQALDVLDVPAGGSSAVEPKIQQDAEKAYTHALMWFITGESGYRDNVLNILDDWASHNTALTGSNRVLTGSLWMANLFYAADIMKSTPGSGWTSTLENKFNAWINEQVIPPTQELVSNRYKDNNGPALARRTLLAYAVYKRDRYQFNYIVETTRRQLALINQTAPWGELSDTTRDYAHGQMMLGGLTGTAEIAWNQGVDSLYEWKQSSYNGGNGDTSYSGTRLAAAADYHSEIKNVGGLNVTPFPLPIGERANANPANWNPTYGVTNSQNSTNTVAPDGGNGTISQWFGEYAYNYYTTTKGRTLPELKKRHDWMRAGQKLDGMIHSCGWGTVTHAEVGAAGPPQTNLALWLQADKDVVSNASGFVSAWGDQSSAARDATQTTTAKQPGLQLNAINGKPALVFAGDDSLFLSSGITASSYTVFAVVKPSSALTNHATIVSGGAGSFQFRIENSSLLQKALKAGNSALGTSSSAIPTASFSRLFVSYASPNLAFRRSGTPDGSASISATFSAPVTTVGERSGSEFFKGEIAELLIYTSPLADADRQIVENYLASKYGL